MDSTNTTTNNNNTGNADVNRPRLMETDANGIHRITDAGVRRFQQALSSGDSVFLYLATDFDWDLLIARLGRDTVTRDFATYVTPDGRSRGTEIVTQGFRGNNNICINRRGHLRLTPARFQLFFDNSHNYQALVDANVTELEELIFLNEQMGCNIHYLNPRLGCLEEA